MRIKVQIHRHHSLLSPTQLERIESRKNIIFFCYLTDPLQMCTFNVMFSSASFYVLFSPKTVKIGMDGRQRGDSGGVAFLLHPPFPLLFLVFVLITHIVDVLRKRATSSHHPYTSFLRIHAFFPIPPSIPRQTVSKQYK